MPAATDLTASRTFRLFVSSTFTDFTAEREALRRIVFPAIDDLCRSFGARFQAVDLRWGISADAGRDQQTLQICLAEIARCQRITPRPNFLILLGDRYGWRPLPPRVPAAEFAAIRALRTDSASRELLGRFYARDDNALPAEYLLCAQPTGADNDPDWHRGEEVLAELLRTAVQELRLNEVDRAKYFASATEQEIIMGALAVADAAEHVTCLRRVVQSDPTGDLSRFFIDRDDSEAGRTAAALRTDLEHRLESHLDRRFIRIDARWEGERLAVDHLGDLPIDPAERLHYLTDPSSHTRTLCDAAWTSLAPIILERCTATALVDDLERETAAHHAFAGERGRFVIGRDDVLATLAAYVNVADAPYPQIVVGASGTGKSAVVARALLDAEHRAGNVVVARFIGATAASTSGTHLLSSLCSGVARALGQTEHRTDTLTYDELVQAFVASLESAGGRQLLLFLDGLDQLAAGDSARNLAWLPHTLPVGVRMVASVLDGELRGLLARKLADTAFIKLEPLVPAQSSALVEHWLAEDQRTLSNGEQHAELQRAASQSGLPLYLRLIFEEARRWRSFDPLPDGADGRRGLPDTVGGAVADLCWRLSLPQVHGAVLVSRALGYLTASRHGLTHDEILGVLSADGGVMQDFRARAPLSPATDSLPDIIWARLFIDLERYLTERDANGTVTLSFFHRVLGELIAERFLAGTDRVARHRHLAEYFQRQPNYSHAGEARSLNRRKLAELPHHLAGAGDWNGLVALIGDFEFLQAQIIGNGVAGAVEDIDRVLAVAARIEGDVAEGLRVLRATLRLSAHILARDPRQLRVQLHARIDRSDLPVVASLLAQSAEANDVWLRPESASFWRPDGAVVSTIVAHAAPLTALALTRDGRTAVSAAKDGTIKIWDLSREAERFVLAVSKTEVTALALTPDDGAIVAGDKDGTIAVWDVVSGTLLRRWQCQGAVRGIAVAMDRQTVLSGTGQHEVLVWDFATGELIRRIPLAQAGSGYFALSADGQRLLVGGVYDYVELVALSSDSVIRTFTHGRDTWVSSVAMTPDGRFAVSGDMDGRVNLWNLDTGAPVARLVIHDYNEKITGLAITPDARWVVAASDRRRLSIFDVSLQEYGVVNPAATMGTGTHNISWLALTADHTRAISAGQDSTLRVWNLESRLGTGLVADRDFSDDDDEDPRIELRRRPFDRESVLSTAGASAAPRMTLTVNGKTSSQSSVAAAADITLTIKDYEDEDEDDERERPKVRVNRRGGDKATWVSPNGAVAAAVAFELNRLACIAQDGTVTVWDLSLETRIAVLPAPENWQPAQGRRSAVPVAVMNEAGTRLMAVRSGHLHLWTIDTSAGRGVAEGVRAPLYGTPDGAAAAAFCDDGWLRMWRLEDGALVRRTRVPVDAVTAFVGDRACWLTPAGELARFDLVHQSKLKSVTVDAPALKLSANAQWGVGVSSDACTLWDLSRGRAVVKLPAATIRSCAFWMTRSGGHAAAAAADDLLLWSIPDGRLLDRVTGDSPFVNCEFVDERKLTADVLSGGTHTFTIEQPKRPDAWL